MLVFRTGHRDLKQPLTTWVHLIKKSHFLTKGMVYKCPNCVLVFKARSDLERHLAKKIKCDAGAFGCGKCKKKFMHQSSKDKHEKACKGPKPTIESLLETSQRNREAMLLAFAEARNVGNNSVSVDGSNNNTINVDNSVNITLNVGEENREVFERMSLEELKEQIGFAPTMDTIFNYTSTLRMDPNHPENHNVRVVDPEGKMALVYTQHMWNNNVSGDYVVKDSVRRDSFEYAQHLEKQAKTPEIEECQKHLKQVANLVMDHPEKYKPHIQRITRALYEFTKQTYAPSTANADPQHRSSLDKDVAQLQQDVHTLLGTQNKLSQTQDKLVQTQDRIEKLLLQNLEVHKNCLHIN